MAVYTAEAVILRKVDYGEADRILTLFTRERGKVPAIAKGVRKAKSRMSGHLDVFAHGQMMLAEGRSMDVVTQFRRITPTASLSGDLARSAAASIVAEVADKVLEDRHPQEDLFNSVVIALSDLSGGVAPPRLAAMAYMMRVLGELGYAPQLATCVRCGGVLAETGVTFSPLAGGLVCADCNRSLSTGFPINARAIKVLRVCASGDRDLFFRLRLDESDLQAVESALESQLEHHLDRQLKSVDFARRTRSRIVQ